MEEDLDFGTMEHGLRYDQMRFISSIIRLPNYKLHIQPRLFLSLHYFHLRKLLFISSSPFTGLFPTYSTTILLNKL
jgi:hypothetical protein